MSDTTKTDLEIILDYMLDYGRDGYLPNMGDKEEGGSGDFAFEAALRLSGVKAGEAKIMTRADLLNTLTKLYDICISNSEKEIINDSCHYKIDDSWFRIAGAISTAEDVVIQEIGNNV